MSMISLEEAAGRLGVPSAAVEEWGKQGLLEVQVLAAGRFVDDEQLFQVSEGLGWLELSAEGWDEALPQRGTANRPTAECRPK